MVRPKINDFQVWKASKDLTVSPVEKKTVPGCPDGDEKTLPEKPRIPGSPWPPSFSPVGFRVSPLF